MGHISQVIIIQSKDYTILRSYICRTATQSEILLFIEQQETQVHDSLGERWIKCKKCGSINTEDKFYDYGGPGNINLGFCYNCKDTNRSQTE